MKNVDDLLAKLSELECENRLIFVWIVLKYNNKFFDENIINNIEYWKYLLDREYELSDNFINGFKHGNIHNIDEHIKDQLYLIKYFQECILKLGDYLEISFEILKLKLDNYLKEANQLTSFKYLLENELEEDKIYVEKVLNKYLTK